MSKLLDNAFNVICVCVIVGLFYIFVARSCEEGGLEIRMDSLTQENIFLESQNAQKDWELAQAELKIQGLTSRGVSLEKDNKILKSHIGSLEAHISTISFEVDKVPTDSVYSILQGMYPTTEIKKYPFSGSQIKSIYITKIERDTLLVLSGELKSLVTNQECQLTLKDSVISQKDLQLSLYKDKVSLKDSIILNNGKILNLTQEDCKKRLRYWKIGTAGAVIVAILVII